MTGRRRFALRRRFLLSASLALVLMLMGCSDGGGGIDGAVDVGMEASPTSTSTRASDDLAEVRGELDEIAQRLGELLDEDELSVPDVTLLDTDSLEVLLDELLQDPAAVEALERDEQLYRILGLTPPDLDLEAITREFFMEGVAGVYVPEREQLYVRLFGRFSAMEESTAAHEYFHYVQDRDFGLEGMQNDAAGVRDREAALSALIEGDASHVQQRYMEEYFSVAEVFGMGMGSALASSTDTSIPLVLLRETMFAYVDGATFVGELLDRGIARGDLYASPPLTTEQVLHPEKYLAGEAGREVTIALGPGVIPEGWAASPDIGLGELLLRTWLEELGAPYSDATTAAAGWGGDASHLLTEDDEVFGLIARVEWDENLDASEFAGITSQALDAHEDYRGLACATCSFPAWEGPSGYFGLLRTDAPDGRIFVAFAVAPTTEILASLIEAAR